MKLFTKAALGALMLAGATALTAAPADAHVSIGIGFGFPGYYGPPPYYAYCDPRSRWFDPYRCDDYDGYDYYDGPVFVDGFWFDGPFRSRSWHGHREFFVHGGWHEGSGFHNDAFRHGGNFGGRNGVNSFSGRGGVNGFNGRGGDFHDGGHRH